MASVAIVTPSNAAKAAASKAHPKVTITGSGATVTLDITDKEAELDDLAAEWEVIRRPGRRPLLEFAGTQLGKVSLKATIGTDRVEADVAPRLAALKRIAVGKSGCLVGSTSGAGASGIRWAITSYRYRVRRRRHGDNAITSARVDLELTEWSAAVDEVVKPGSASLGTKSSSASTAKAATLGGAPVRRVTVAAGETLWTIADRYYGDGNLWPRIADANGIVDTRAVVPGVVLTLP